VLFTFDDARAGNEKETVAADADIADLEFSFQASVLGSKVSVRSVPPTSVAKSAGDGRGSETILLLFFLACSAISAATIFFLLFPADGTSRRL
jgi:hypothetical protein